MQPIGGERGLGLAVDDFEVEADLALRRGRGIRRRWRPSGRLRWRSGARASPPRLRILSRQIVERLDRALDRRLAEPAGGRHALAEANDARERVDDAESLAVGRATSSRQLLVPRSSAA